MSFTITKEVPILTLVQSLGGLLIDNSETKSVTLTISARSVDYITEDKCGVYFDVSTENVSTMGTLYHEFEYSGKEHPFAAGESALLDYLKNGI